MSLDPELKELFTQTLRVRRRVEGPVNEYGERTFEETFIDIPCHINSRVHEMIGRNGQSTLSTGVASIDIVPWLTYKERCYVPELSSPTGWREVNIIGVQTRYDEDGPHHMQVFFGEK